MNRIFVLFLVILFTCCDITLTTVMYCHGNQCYLHFSVSVSKYNFDVSVFDIWLISLFRCAISIGLILALICNPTDTIARTKQYSSLPVILCGSLTAFTLVKLLALSEVEKNLSNVWLWAIFASTICFSIFFVINWILISRTVLPACLEVTINSEGRETEPLLPDSVKNAGFSSSEDKEKEKKKGSILRLISLSRPDLPVIITAFVFLTVSATGEIFVPYYTGRVVDGIVIDKSRKEFITAITDMALISAASAIAAGIRGGCFIIAINRLNIRIRKLLFSSIVSQEIGFFDRITTACGAFCIIRGIAVVHVQSNQLPVVSMLPRDMQNLLVKDWYLLNTGDIISRLTSDTTTMSDTVGLNINIFLRSSIKAVGVIFFMLKLSWRMSVVTLIGLPCIMTVSKVYGKKFKKLQTKAQDSLADANKIAEEACSTIRTVRSFANEAGESARYAASLGKTYQLYKKQALLYAGFIWATQLFQLALTVSVLYYGGHLVLTGKLTGGTLISFILYQLQLGDCFNNMGNVYTGLMQAAGASEKVFEYIDREPEMKNNGKLTPKDLRGQIEFRNVSFHYPSRPDSQVLKNISFIVSPGEVVALVGPSGGGKTSCIYLLKNLYTPVSGQVLLDSEPVSEYEHHYLHRQMSLVGQDPVLYARSVTENIAYGLLDSEWKQQDIEKAARLANAHSFITEMKDGYQTDTGEKGVQLSGGQKQRVAIARALLRNPKILLLDEATSALDSESEFAVQQALYQNLNCHTVIIIAHRLSTVERANRIIVIDRGEIREQGSHQQLLKRKGLYASLVKRQLLDSDSTWLGARGSSKDLRDISGTCPCRRRRCSGRNWSGGSQLSEDDADGPPRATFIIGSA